MKQRLSDQGVEPIFLWCIFGVPDDEAGFDGRAHPFAGVIVKISPFEQCTVGYRLDTGEDEALFKRFMLEVQRVGIGEGADISFHFVDIASGREFYVQIQIERLSCVILDRQLER